MTCIIDVDLCDIQNTYRYNKMQRTKSIKVGFVRCFFHSTVIISSASSADILPVRYSSRACSAFPSQS